MNFKLFCNECSFNTEIASDGTEHYRVTGHSLRVVTVNKDG